MHSCMSAATACQTGVNSTGTEVVQGRVCGTCGVSRELGMYVTKTCRDVRTCRKCRDHSRKHFLGSKIKQPDQEWLNRLAEQVRALYDSPWQDARGVSAHRTGSPRAGRTKTCHDGCGGGGCCRLITHTDFPLLLPNMYEMAENEEVTSNTSTTSTTSTTVSRLCELCSKPLVAIGRARANGKRGHGDWESRVYHKSCWKLLQDRAPKRRFRRYKRFTRIDTT